MESMRFRGIVKIGEAYTMAIAGVLMCLAAVLYTTAVLVSLRELKLWHTLIFISGFTADSIGTHLMFVETGNVFRFNLHSLIGVSALTIMGIHAFWAIGASLRVGVLYGLFHKYSKVALAIWFIAFVTGVIVGMKDLAPPMS